MSRIVEGGILTVLFFLVINVVFLNIFFLSQRSVEIAATTEIEVPVCDEICQKKISEKILAKITPEIQEEIKFTEGKKAQEFIIPLGNGTTSSKEYESIIGVESSIDTALYPNIKKVVFETYMTIPTANGVAFAKLFNVTDKHDVWYSEQSMETNVVTMRESNIMLDKGKKLYRVMMKSTMGYDVKLNNARIRIITE